MKQRLAAVQFEKGDDVDAIFFGVCDALRAKGHIVGGVAQTVCSSSRPGCPADVRVIDLSTQETFSVWDYRGVAASGCRLDETGLASTDQILASAISDRVDLLIVNRFGRAEYHGRGTLASFADAISAGIPILTAVRPPYVEAWERFHGGYGISLPQELTAVLDWFNTISALPDRIEPMLISV